MMESEEFQSTTIEAIDESAMGKPAGRRPNKNLAVAFIIGGVALAMIIALVLVITFTAGRKHSQAKPYAYAPNGNATMVTFDADMNLGDAMRYAIPTLSQLPNMQDPETQNLIRNLPNLEFLECSGFVLIAGEEPYSAIGLRLSGRGDAASSYRNFVEKISSIKGVKAKIDKDGFVQFEIEPVIKLVTYLDSDFLLLGDNASAIKNLLETKAGRRQSVETNPRWPRIQERIEGSPFAFFTVFAHESKEQVITGKLSSSTGELGMEAAWLDGVASMTDVLPKNMDTPNFKDILKWQTGLGKLLSQTPDGVIRMALPFTFGDNPEKFIEGETSGYVTLTQKLEADVIAVRMRGDIARIKASLENSIIGKEWTTVRELGEGVFEATLKKSGMQEKPAEPPPAKGQPKKPANPNSKTPEPVVPPIERPEPSELLPFPTVVGGFINDRIYFRYEGDTAYVSNKLEGLKWVSGKTENVSGSILSVAIDGKFVLSAIADRLLEAGDKSVESLGFNTFLLGSILDNLDPMLYIDLNGQSSDLVLKLTMKFNQRFLMQ